MSSDFPTDPLLEILDQALARPKAERAAFVQRRCGTDKELLARVMQLLDEESGSAEWDLASPRSLLTPILGSENYPLLGQRIGPWKLIQVLGEGGMGTVYLGERMDEAFTQEVAIKLIKEDVRQGKMLERFDQERHIHAGLDHPGIATLLDAGRTDGTPYFVMEYVPGQRIDDHCEALDLGANERIDLLVKVCRVVHDMHEQGIVHRDLKPSNIMVQPDGSVKLLDFGVALVLRGGDTPSDGELPFVTPAYSSPEAFQGQEITCASDQYSLAVILQELLTDRRPAPASSANQTNTQALAALLPGGGNGPQKLQRGSLASYPERGRFLRDLRAILGRALNPDPRRRYAAVHDLEQDLDRLVQGEVVSAYRPSSFEAARRRIGQYRWSILGLGILATLLIGSSVFIQRKENDYRRALQQSTTSRAEAEKHAGTMEDFAKKILSGLEQRLRSAPEAYGIRERLLAIGTEFFESSDESERIPAGLLVTVLDAYRFLAMLQAKPMVGGGSQVLAAVASFDKALSLVDQLENEDPHLGRWYRAMILISWATIDNDNLHLMRARKRLQTALTILDENPGEFDSANALGFRLDAQWNLADNFVQADEFDKARETLQRFRKLYDGCAELRQSDPYLAGVCHMFLLSAADSMLALGDRKVAEGWYRQALEDAWSHPNTPDPNSQGVKTEMDLTSLVGYTQRIYLDWEFASEAERPGLQEGLHFMLDGMENKDITKTRLPSEIAHLHTINARMERKLGTLDAAQEAYEAAFRLWRYNISKDPENTECKLSLSVTLMELADTLTETLAGSPEGDPKLANKVSALRQEARGNLEALRRLDVDHPRVEKLIQTLEAFQ